MTPSSLSQTMSPASVMVTWFTVIPCARFRILTTLSARPGSFLEMPQADDVVEQEHQPFQRLGGDCAADRLAGGQERDTGRADESHEAAHVSGEAVPFTVGEDGRSPGPGAPAGHGAG